MEELFINKNENIREAIKKLDSTAKKILLVIEDGRLIGTITDGDIRRWILKSGDLQKEVFYIMNKNPIYLDISNKYKAKKIIKEKQINAMPIVDKNRKVVDIVFLNELYNGKFHLHKEMTTPVVIMAGGKGTRLYPYTKILPKPLIPIGDLSISERIIEKFKRFGCRNFYFTVNYKKNMIKAYFDELTKDYKITYVEEGNFLGTAGSLHLLKNRIKETFFVSNCDILVDADYIDILKYHREKGNLITVITSLKNYTIPYGIIRLNEDGDIVGTHEKPQYDFLVNAGVYILEPEVLNEIPENTFFHITDLIDKCIEKGKKVGTYPITENSWLDMGEIKEMERMVNKLNLQ